MTRIRRGGGRWNGGWAGVVLVLSLLVGGAAQAAAVHVSIFAINDLHGNLLPPGGGIPGDARPAGGVARMATLLKRQRALHPNNIFVAAGDLVGASPLLSGLFHDEPTVEALSAMRLEASAVGNHELDKGAAELLRLQKGGCHPVDGCRGGHVFKGARFQYLAANVMTANGAPLLPPYTVKRFSGIPVAFVGLTLKDAPQIVAPAGIAGLQFRDEAQSVNALVPQLRAKGIEAIVVLIHQGAETTGGPNDCVGMMGPIAAIVRQFDKAVDVVVSGHTHQAYNCVMDGRLVTSAHRYGTMVTRIDLRLDRKSHDVLSARAENLAVDDGRYRPDPGIAKIVARYQALAAPLAGRIVGTVTAPVLAARSAAGESALGDLVADGELASAPDARIALMNPGGLRTDIAAAGPVTHAALFAVLPFGNQVTTLDLTGAQIRALLEQQWSPSGTVRILQVSKGFSYRWDAGRPLGARVVADSLMLDGVPLSPGAPYRVAVPDFLAGGGDGMTVLLQGQNRSVGKDLLTAVADYLTTHSPYTPAAMGRIGSVVPPR